MKGARNWQTWKRQQAPVIRVEHGRVDLPRKSKLAPWLITVKGPLLLSPGFSHVFCRQKLLGVICSVRSTSLRWQQIHIMAVIIIIIITINGENYEAMQLKCRSTSRQSLRTSCYYWASCQTSDIAIRFKRE